MTTSHLMCANFFVINLNVIITLMLQLFNYNRETLVCYMLYMIKPFRHCEI